MTDKGCIENPLSHLSRHRELLGIEYRSELEQFRTGISRMPLHVRVRRGICWASVRLGRSYYNSLNQYILEVERNGRTEYGRHTADEPEDHLFEYGTPVRFFRTGLDGKTHFFDCRCTVSFVDGDRMAVAVPGEAAVSRLRDVRELGIQRFFDETTYTLMFSAIDAVMSARDNRLAELRDILLGQAEARRHSMNGLRFPWLNDSQQNAVNGILGAKDVMVVHGPPGTGKTTTLVEAIYETLFRENQVMVCAQSNLAVDWICEKLQDRGVPVLRIGNPARVEDRMLSSTYERKFEEHPDYPLLWSIRKSIREMRSAGKDRRTSAFRDRLHELRQKATDLEYTISDSVVSGARVIACTLAGSASKVLAGRRFSTLFVDEAAQALEAAAWIAICKADRVIFAGDHCQLPPTVKSVEALEKGLGKTLMETVVKNKPDCVSMLEVQYRMNAAIMRFSSDVFYGGRLRCAPFVENRMITWNSSPVEWTDTAGMGFRESVSEDGTGRYNEGEAAKVLDVLQEIVSDISVQRIKDENIDFGIISPYRSQVSLLRRMLSARPELKPVRKHVSVNTVDGFQGRERDVVIISMVRSNDDGTIGFLSELRRMNVAITRARYRLVIVGDFSTLGRHRFYRLLHSYMDSSRYE